MPDLREARAIVAEALYAANSDVYWTGDEIAKAAKAILPLIALAEARGEERMRKWQPIETAPMDGKEILLGHAQAVFSGYWSEDANGWVTGETDLYEDLIVYHPTDWQPLPAPPSRSLPIQEEG